MKKQEIKTKLNTIDGEYVPAYENTTPVNTESNHPIWSRGFLLRKLPGIDPLVPVQVFFDPQTGKICMDTIPPEFREELEQFSFSPEIVEPPISKEESTNDNESWDSFEDNENNDIPNNDESFASWNDDIDEDGYSNNDGKTAQFDWEG